MILEAHSLGDSAVSASSATLHYCQEVAFPKSLISYSFPNPLGFPIASVATHNLLLAIGGASSASTAQSPAHLSLSASIDGLLRGHGRNTNLYSIPSLDNAVTDGRPPEFCDLGTVHDITIWSPATTFSYVSALDINGAVTATQVERYTAAFSAHCGRCPMTPHNQYFAIFVPPQTPTLVQESFINHHIHSHVAPGPPSAPFLPSSGSLPTPPLSPTSTSRTLTSASVSSACTYSPVVVSPATLENPAIIDASYVLEMIEQSGFSLVKYHNISTGGGSTLTDSINRHEMAINIIERCGCRPLASVLYKVADTGKFELTNGSDTPLNYYDHVVKAHLGYGSERSFDDKTALFDFAEEASRRRWKEGRATRGNEWTVHQQLIAFYQRRRAGYKSAPRKRGAGVGDQEKLASKLTAQALKEAKKALDEDFLYPVGESPSENV
ncbi:hypothetical protein AAF712_007835 [Marasmius tenuissimus]|uniref:Uncharacterized protein n=1 Tax=Marasmius tenuissimus TaxID=585030 RepID=A0ABR2ZV39_9AGAR|nr:hypothetical protein PM082_000959 [Marasmius tenuissimus]KAJ8084415.1 hypothetical protein PM082_003184 [Marasmius tenuissimus]